MRNFYTILVTNSEEKGLQWRSRHRWGEIFYSVLQRHVKIWTWFSWLSICSCAGIYSTQQLFHTKYNYFNHTSFLLLKYIQGGDMFRLYRAIFRPYLKNRYISLSSTWKWYVLKI